MAWTYDSTDLSLNTSAGRLNVVRFLVGDTDSTDQQVENEEINFAVAIASDDVYAAAVYIANSLSAKFARFVDTDLDGQLSEKYSQLSQHYKALAHTIMSQKAAGGKVSLGIYAGGLPAVGKTNTRISVNQFDIYADREILDYELEE